MLKKKKKKKKKKKHITFNVFFIYIYQCKYMHKKKETYFSFNVIKILRL